MKKTNRKKRPIKFTRGMTKRLKIMFSIIVIGLVVLVGRLVYIYNNQGDEFNIKVLEQQNYSNKTIPYKRGDILDRNGVVLATSIKVYNLILDPKIMLSDDGKYLEPTLEALNVCFGYDINEIRQIVNENSKRSYYVYAKKLTYEQMETFLDMQKDSKTYPNIQGVWFESEYERKYPFSSLACNVLGFTSAGNVGVWGIEEYYNSYLNGVDGREYGYVNNNNVMEQVKKPAENGNNVVSTIDFNVQTIVEKWVKYYADYYQPENLGVLIMDPRNGEILAMAGMNSYDLNNPRDLTAFYSQEEIDAMTDEDRLDALNKIWRNYCISDTYEPGSTAKPFTIASALEEGKIEANINFTCDGIEQVGGWNIKCHKKSGHGIITIQQALAFSCNDAMMQAAVDQGRDIFVDYQSRFGFGSKTRIDLPGEESCENLVKDTTMGEADLATNSFGQNFNTTMVQLGAGFCSVINGGYYYQPHVTKQILNENGGIVETFEKNLVKQVVTKETSDIIKEGLKMCVESGTGTKAAIDGYTIAGKTGTAEKYPRGTGEYLLSFIGFAPYDNPEVVCYVVLDNPVVEGEQMTSHVLEVWTAIMSEVLPYIDIFKEVQEVAPDAEPDNIDGSLFEEEYNDIANNGDGSSPADDPDRIPPAPEPEEDDADDDPDGTDADDSGGGTDNNSESDDNDNSHSEDGGE